MHATKNRGSDTDPRFFVVYGDAEWLPQRYRKKSARCHEEARKPGLRGHDSKLNVLVCKRCGGSRGTLGRLVSETTLPEFGARLDVESTLDADTSSAVGY
ncbi:hypothetical protein FHX49_001025 [Microbacterium endophyticum]|uniref:Uncharacterized protein n=1 Tax=Microbacterium endophyticum TaxID=1526412 RepID=A0A7W4YMG0_9MICO|nr:hypothetical protein [Microbacterium endophyticum]NIK35522.1 hypothetical protein [Microbacterium endophyticum]